MIYIELGFTLTRREESFRKIGLEKGEHSLSIRNDKETQIEIMNLKQSNKIRNKT